MRAIKRANTNKKYLEQINVRRPRDAFKPKQIIYRRKYSSFVELMRHTRADVSNSTMAVSVSSSWSRLFTRLYNLRYMHVQAYRRQTKIIIIYLIVGVNSADQRMKRVETVKSIIECHIRRCDGLYIKFNNHNDSPIYSIRIKVHFIVHPPYLFNNRAYPEIIQEINALVRCGILNKTEFYLLCKWLSS